MDDCQGAVCPKGQVCVAGSCTAEADGGAGAGGSGADGGIVFGGSGGGGAKAGSGGSAAKDGGMGATAALPGTEPANDSGCGCRTAQSARAGWLALLSLAALGFGLGRRRRR